MGLEPRVDGRKAEREKSRSRLHWNIGFCLDFVLFEPEYNNTVIFCQKREVRMSNMTLSQTFKTITLQLPEALYVRLQQTAQATQQSLETTLLRVLQVGSPPTWETAPAEFQADLAALDRLDDAALWRIARYHAAATQMERYQELLDTNADAVLSSSEKEELHQLRTEMDRAMLRKVHAAALLRWRGHQLPPPEQL